MNRVAAFGDSLIQETEGNSEIAKQGKGSAMDLVGRWLGQVSGIGPRLSTGFRGVWLATIAGDKSGEWTRAGTWTAPTTSDLHDKLMYRQGGFANGSANTYTYTHPVTETAGVAFELYWVDYASGGNWSYRVNGGTWTAMSQTLALDSKLCKFRVATALAPGDTVDVRAANAAGTGVGCWLGGIEVLFSTSTTGFILDNYGVNGQTLHTLMLATAGDPLAIVDNVRLGTGSPNSSTPTASFVKHINDAALNNVANWGTDQGSFFTRLSPLGTVGFICPWESGTGTTGVTQDSYRNDATNGTHAKATALGAKILDLYDALKALGYGSALGTQNTALSAAGYVIDGTHASQAGYQDFAVRLYWWLRSQFFASTINQPVALPVTGKRAAVGYTAKRAAVAYAARIPITV